MIENGDTTVRVVSRSVAFTFFIASDVPHSFMDGSLTNGRMIVNGSLTNGMVVDLI